MIRAALIALGALLASTAGAVECRDMTHEGIGYTLCEVDAAKEDLRLFLTDEAGDTWSHFATLDAALDREGKRLAFAMNAGMYHDDRRPVGHYVENGVEVMRVVPNTGPGNFGLGPGGVFCIGEDTARVIETQAFLDRQPRCRHATQSGPMLVIGGALHPRFLPDSTSRYIRNGVGTSANGTRAVFAISRETVTFHEFARLFRDGLNLPDALYFDGNISRLYAPGLNRRDPGFPMGPIVGVVAAK